MRVEDGFFGSSNILLNRTSFLEAPEPLALLPWAGPLFSPLAALPLAGPLFSPLALLPVLATPALALPTAALRSEMPDRPPVASYCRGWSF